jgi:thiamine biosynthesis lipoprotein
MPDTTRIARQLAALERLGFALDVEEAEPAGPPARRRRDVFRVVDRRPAMSTLVTVIALSDSADRAEEAIGEALREMQRLIAIFDRRNQASALGVLNDAGRLDAPPPELVRVLARAVRYHDLSGGAFDVTVAPLLDLFRAAFGGPSPREPDAAEIAGARERLGMREVRVSGQGVRLGRPGMALTLDGIAKGFIVDAMAAALARRGVTRFLVEAGGDVRASGAREGGEPWTVAVRDPAAAAVLPGILRLTGGAVATSGSYERRHDAAGLFHHIVDGVTGTSPHECASATVVAPSALAADALATTVCVLGPLAGLALVERLPRCACLVMAPDGRRAESIRWKEFAS